MQIPDPFIIFILFIYALYCVSEQEAGLLTMVNNPIHRPFTMLWPTDAVFNSFPEKRQKWLYHKDHRDELAAYLKVHMIRDMKVKIVIKKVGTTAFLLKQPSNCSSLA